MKKKMNNLFFLQINLNLSNKKINNKKKINYFYFIIFFYYLHDKNIKQIIASETRLLNIFSFLIGKKKFRFYLKKFLKIKKNLF